MHTHHSNKTTLPIAWTIAGSDSGGGAGIQADLASFHDLGVHGCSIITALTAQNSHQVTHILPTSPENLLAQMTALATDLPARAIKIGMLGNSETVNIVSAHLQHYQDTLQGTVIFDPVMVSTSGASLCSKIEPNDLITSIFPYVDLITPNTDEAEMLLGQPIDSLESIEKAAKQLHQLGAKAVLIKGGHSHTEFSQDFYYSTKQQFWLSTKRITTQHTHGSGCTLSAAIAACCALGYTITDALVIAKTYVTQGIRQAQAYGKGPGPVAHAGWPTSYRDLPWLTSTLNTQNLASFPRCRAPLGFYPIVDSSGWVERLLKAGVKTIQLRIKPSTSEKPDQDALESEMIQSIQLAKAHHAQLFINDHWQLAIKHQAYGVHLGQDDLETASIKSIRTAGLRLGISTHCYAEIARALAIKPSYIAYGPIYRTTAKPMAFEPQGTEKLLYWQKMLSAHYPLVAIGGISLERLADVLSTGVDGIAVISAITQAENPEQTIQNFLSQMNTVKPIEPVFPAKAGKTDMPQQRYSRQICLPQIGYTGQKQLQNTRVLCIGAGGLGSPLLLYLAAAGIGTLGIVDDDTVSLHNLHRQILYQTQDCGQKKVTVAAQRLKALNPDIEVIAHDTRLTPVNALALIQDYDIIADGSDNFTTRYVINDTCFAVKKPLVSASILQFSGQLLTFIPPTGPCYRCLFEEQANQDLPNCNEAGVLGAAAGVLGTLQATEVIKLALGIASHATNQLLRVNLETLQFQQFSLTRDPTCSVCQAVSEMTEKPPSETLTTPESLTITPEDFQIRQRSKQSFTLLDVRTPQEHEAHNMGGLLIPLDELSDRYTEIPTKHPIIVYCHLGQRSLIAAQFLNTMGLKAKSLAGGVI